MNSNRKILFQRAIMAILFFVGNWLAPICSAQPFYESKTYNPNLPPTSGSILGVLYNSQPYLIENFPTTYHGNQNVYATAYLPFIESEYNAAKPVQLFGSYYTTAIALCSPKDPAKGLYAPVHIVSEEPKSELIYALASVVPYGPNNLKFKGPFNTLKYLNVKAAGFTNPVSSEYGVTALKTAQEFTKFSHDLLTDQNGIGWNGFDQAGIVPIACFIKPTFGSSYYQPANGFVTICKYKTGTMEVTRSIMGHEFFHGIVDHVPGYDQSLISAARSQMEEGMAAVIGVGFSNWLSQGKFDNPNWNMFWENPNDPQMWLNNPKIRSRPSTYQGEFYKENWLADGYDVHDNGHIVGYAFAALVEGLSGNVDDNPDNAPFTVLQLVPGNKSESYKLGLRIFFNAFIRKLALDVQYPDFRMATLAAAIDLGYVKGTHAYKQLENAWSAVGVESTFYNKNCVQVTAESLLNGAVTFNAQEGTQFPSPASQKMHVLNDCSNYNPVGTYFNNTATGHGTSYENTQIYSEDGDLSKSKIMVSVHYFTQVARDWFMSKLGLDGMSGKGQFVISNVFSNLTNLPIIYTLGTLNPSAKIPYTYDSESACRDRISENYFDGVNTFNKFDQVQVASSSDWKALRASLSQIFSLEIKKEYEVLHQNPTASQIRTLYEELSTDALLVDFENPKLHGQPVVYHGANWNDNEPLNNAGVLNKVYDLLIHGSDDPDGYNNGEANSQQYVIFPVDKDIVLKTFWVAYKDASVASSLDEFRLATMKALHDLNPAFDEKSKEHHAFYDAWAAALNLPDYASTLKHTPKDGDAVYPWTTKVGVEVEYKLYESERFFEASKSPKFNANEWPVHQFTSNAAPDLSTSMVYGLVNLEPGQTYYIRSRLSNAGDPRDGCAVTPDPAFCELLKTKQKWTLPYEFNTEKVDAVSNVLPLAETEAPAWAAPFSWTSVAGASGYGINITDNEVFADHLVQHEAFYDEDQPQSPVETVLALSKERKYVHSIAARQRLGSEWAVHVLPNGMLVPFTDDEIDNRPFTYGPWTEPASFFTGLPEIVPGVSPANGEHVPLLGPPFTLSASGYDPSDGYLFEYKEPYHSEEKDQPTFDFLLSNVPSITDLEEIKWAFTPYKDPVPGSPFITEREKGATEWRSFVADMSLSPAPKINANGLVCFAPGQNFTASWQKVDQATDYKYLIREAGTDIIVAEGTTENLATPSIASVTKYPAPGSYIFEVSAGYKNTDGELFWGPKSTMPYGVRPPVPVGLVPNGNVGEPLQAGHFVALQWEESLDQTVNQKHKVMLLKKNGNGFDLLSNFVNKVIEGNEAIASDLEYNTVYQWKVTNQTEISGCPSEWAEAIFKTEPDPEEYDLGFTVMVEDHQSSTGIDITGVSLTYKVTVIRPDGTVDFLATDRYSNGDPWTQVDFAPGEGQILANGNINGQLTDQTGDYTIELEILSVCHGCAEANAKPEITIKGIEYKKKKNESDWTQNEEFSTIPEIQTFPGRTVGAKKILQFHYELP